MLSKVCKHICNYFTASSYNRFFDSFTISDSRITPPVPIRDGQYFAIFGSTFNDGVHRSGDVLIDEEFEGSVWLMSVPQDFLDLVSEMEEWQTLHAAPDKMSPYQSESFGGYTYSKAAGKNGAPMSVFEVYASRLNPYRKVRP